MDKHIKLIKKTFWYFCLPLIGIEALYFFLKGINPLDSYLFLLSSMLCFPVLLVKLSETQDKAYNNLLVEFREMTTIDFAECEHEIMTLPISRNGAMMKEAYRQVFREKYGRDIF